jgi:leader peptidase (prepilin peptidase)/N-methyltransferase
MNLTLIIPLLLGWLAGWLTNYLIDVLPTTRTFSTPACRHCQQEFRLVDYLIFRNCTNCGKPRGLRAVIVQVIMTVAPIFLWVFPRERFPFILAFTLLIFLMVVFVIDWEHRLILHPVSLIGAILALIIGINLRSGQSFVHGLTSTLFGGAFGFGVMLLFYFIGEWYVRRMAKKGRLPADEVALGFGDVNLSGILGLLLGWPAIIIGLFFAILAGGLISLFIIIGMLATKKYKAFTAIPYAPFLILSAVFLLYIL